MDKELIRKRLELRYKPKARPMNPLRAKALLAQYGQTYNPGGQDQSQDEKSTKNEE